MQNATMDTINIYKLGKEKKQLRRPKHKWTDQNITRRRKTQSSEKE